MPNVKLGIRQQSPETFSVATMISRDDLFDEGRERLLFALQVADQSARLDERDGFRCPRDQSCRLLFLSKCGIGYSGGTR